MESDGQPGTGQKEEAETGTWERYGRTPMFTDRRSGERDKQTEMGDRQQQSETDIHGETGWRTRTVIKVEETDRNREAGWRTDGRTGRDTQTALTSEDWVALLSSWFVVCSRLCLSGANGQSRVKYGPQITGDGASEPAKQRSGGNGQLERLKPAQGSQEGQRRYWIISQGP